MRYGFALPARALDPNCGFATASKTLTWLRLAASPRDIHSRFTLTQNLAALDSGKAMWFKVSFSLNHILLLKAAHRDQLIEHAKSAAPAECCGIITGTKEGAAVMICPLRNIAADPLVSYEAAPEDLFAAQKEMRARGEQLLAIYHSHPHSADPHPSETDVRLAYYPAAIYLIIGFESNQPVMRAFRIFESQRRWEPVEYQIFGE